MIRFCVVDDHEIIHDGLRAMADREPDLEFAGATTRPDDAVALVRRARPDVLLLDLRLGANNSTGLCAELAGTFPNLAVLMFSAYGNAELLTQAIRAGAAGYVVKDTSTTRIPDILRELRRTGTYFDPKLAGGLLRRSIAPEGDEAAFSQRELDIVRCIAHGQDNHAIGERLHISPHTVKFHVNAMLRRHQLQRRTELVRLVMQMHLLDS
ncbi:MAG: response regulator transcription factor [Pseudonocardia sp.]|nr:response regulator transcription factor [Pseudonocardia sp.]